MMNFHEFYQIIAKNHLSHWLDTLPAQISIFKKKSLHRSFNQWKNSVKFLPNMTPYKINLLHGVMVQSKTPLKEGQRLRIKKLMLNLMPWRKGPFSLYGIDINTEWRSDWKWQRILPHFSDLNGLTILDIGCGNGYYLWRMLGAGANLAVGIDPTTLFLYQFEAVRKLLGNNHRAYLLPIGIEQLPALKSFDVVFSMGMLYHCRSPIEHLFHIKNQMVNQGKLVIETLVIQGNETSVLVPENRYAQMRNVYFIPSVLALKSWLKKCGFIDIRIADICMTTIKEQHSTEWMNHHSLADFLNPNDATKTIEGYPAPMRAVLIAKKP